MRKASEWMNLSESLLNESTLIWGRNNIKEYVSSLSISDLKRDMLEYGFSKDSLENLSKNKLIELLYNNSEFIDDLEKEEFYDSVEPMISKQTYNDIVILYGLLGTTGIYGGKAIYTHELYDGDWNIDKMEIVEEDGGQLMWKGYFSSGVHQMYLYSIPQEEEKLNRFILETNLVNKEKKTYGYNEDSAIQMVVDDLSPIYLNNNIENWDKVKELAKPIINGFKQF